MSWRLFLELRKHAHTIAVHEGYPVYLVGSVLQKVRPRDIDVAVVMPLADFESRFGKLPRQGPGSAEYGEYMRHVRDATLDYYLAAQLLVDHRKRVDLRFTPDTWWPEKDRLLLASPYDRQG